VFTKVLVPPAIANRFGPVEDPRTSSEHNAGSGPPARSTQLLAISWPLRKLIASLMVMLNQFAVIWSPGMNAGSSATPAVQLFETSGVRLGLPDTVTEIPFPPLIGVNALRPLRSRSIPAA
jgi:hypothetical protein